MVKRRVDYRAQILPAFEGQLLELLPLKVVFLLLLFFEERMDVYARSC